VNPNPVNLLLADDDADDCIFFKEALEELSHATELTTVNDGVELMHLLSAEDGTLPDALYLDLNMPRKSGFECLSEIKQNDKLKYLPVIIFSTSFNPEVVTKLHDQGADYYIRKPADFSDLKKIISISLELLSKGNLQPSIENFVLNSK
jgi:CheY-like chemotaxis protein